MPVNLKAQQHIDKARLFHSQWQSSSEFSMPLEWTLVAIYYETLHWYSAAVIHLHVSAGLVEPDVGLHRLLRDAVHEVRASIPKAIRTNYVDLEAISRRARYAVAPSTFVIPAEVPAAIAFFEKVKTWAPAQLLTAGYSC